uniref:Uncharacterized protein n=1 Tax=Oryza brachyantha TaxID=4533 RepID=J3LVP7_ORYBR
MQLQRQNRGQLPSTYVCRRNYVLKNNTNNRRKCRLVRKLTRYINYVRLFGMSREKSQMIYLHVKNNLCVKLLYTYS